MEGSFRAYFARLDALPEARRRVLFALPDPAEYGDPVSVVFTDERTDTGWRIWRPVYASERTPPDVSFLGEAHPDARSYFASAFFGEIHARFEETSFSLTGVFPETLAEDFARRVHGHPRLVPIGLERPSDLQVVLDLDDASVAVWDWEREVRRPIAPSVRALVAGMIPE